MNHLFAPYDLALLAKEKGFDESCFGGYEQEGKEFRYYIPNDFLKKEVGLEHMEHYNHVNCNLIDAHCTAPLWQQLVDWFREKHDVFIQIDIAIIRDTLVHSSYIIRITPVRTGIPYTSGFNFNYTEALTAAIRHAFTLIP